MSVNSIGSGNSPHRMQGMPRPQSFTEEQKGTVESILSEYDATELTEEDAQAINESFAEAGFKGGFGLFQSIQEAGFDPEEIRSLDPSSPAGRPKGPPPPPPPPSGVQGLNTDALAELQTILENYDLENLSSDDETSLISQLENSGLLLPGLMVNTSV